MLGILGEKQPRAYLTEQQQQVILAKFNFACANPSCSGECSTLEFDHICALGNGGTNEKGRSVKSSIVFHTILCCECARGGCSATFG